MYPWKRRAGWWLRNPRFLLFQAREAGGFVSALFGLLLLYMLVRYHEGVASYDAFLAMLSTPVALTVLAVSFAFVSLVQVTLILTVGRLVFDVNVQGSYLWLALTAIIGVVCMLSIGYTIASFARTVQSFSAVQQLVAFPMLFLGRSYFPIDPSPALRPVVEFVPLTHLNDALREIINHGGGPGDLWVSWAVLAAWAVGGFLVSMRLFRWQ